MQTPWQPPRRATLDAAAQRILPTDHDGESELDGAGAREAQAAAYVERLLDGRYRAFTPSVVAGLDWLQKESQRRYAKDFESLLPVLQDELLSESLTVARLERFMPILVSLVLEGSLCDPSRGGNRDERGWRAIGCRWE